MRGVRVLAAGLDSVYVSAHGVLRDGLLTVLRALQHDAATESEPVVVELREDAGAFLLRPHGWRGYPVRMDAPNYTVCIGAAKPFPPVYVMVRSSFLHHMGAEDAVALTREMVERDLFGAPVPLQVSRADVYADVQGWRPVPGDLHRFICRASWRRLFEEPVTEVEVPRRLHSIGRRFSGFVFGKGDVVARVYDKTLELAHRGETWPQVVWTGYDEARPVWRVEFQFRRRALHEFGVGHVHELLAGRQDLWEYGTRWLSLRRRVPGLRPGRWPEANAWTVIRDARMGSPRSGLVRQRIYEASVERLVRGFVGYSTSLAAAGAIGDVASLIQTVPPAQRYVVHRGMSLDDVIARKRALRLSAQPSFTVGRCQQGDMQGDPDAAAQPPRRGGGGAPYMEPAS
ncbi:MAG TPA: hypothetical protein VFC09_07195 [Candidatus Dormibacteraeota bacterium]|nr:hypothetical protein [Candidatus Dormibacteraeota bacterium]